MSEREGGHLPCPPMRNRPAANGTAYRKEINIEPQENNETTAAGQIGFLRQRLSLGYSLAAALAPLIWGLPK